MRGFAGFKRRAVVICPTDEDLKQRTLKREKEEGKDVPDSAVLEMKANFKLPEVGDFFDSVEFVEMSREESQNLIETYNKEGQAASPNKFNNRNDGGRDRRDYNDRGGRDNYRSGSYNNNNNNNNFRGGWDRDRDRRGGYDRRDRGGWNRNNNRDITSRLGTGGSGSGGGGGGGYNRENRNAGGSSGGYNRDNRGGYNRGGGFRDNRGGGRSYQASGGSGGYHKYQDSPYQGSSSWSQSGSGPQYNQSYNSYGHQGTAYSTPSYSSTTAASGYGQTGGYGWSQQQPQSYYAQQPGGTQSYYSPSYRADSSTPATANTWGAASSTSNTWPQSTTWGQTPAAAAAAAPAAPAAQTHGSWGSSAYSQPAAPSSWSHQSYGGYYGRK